MHDEKIVPLLDFQSIIPQPNASKDDNKPVNKTHIPILNVCNFEEF